MSHGPWTWVQIPASPKNEMGKYGLLDGTKYIENFEDMGQVTPKIFLKSCCILNKKYENLGKILRQ